MDTDAFWRVIDAARDSDEPLNVAVAALLSGRTAEEVLAFEYRFARLRSDVHRWDVWAAAYLIGGGCSDDRFSDFTAGLVALGREWYERAATCPDALAEHPTVRAAAAAGDQDAVFAEEFNFVSSRAYERLTDDEDDFWEAWEAYSDARATTDEASSEGMGESFDFDDALQMRRRLPQLAELYLGPALG
ncbi:MULTISPECIES: DUF4240 domain-containing protein [unclassified Streptomyces]|uniref:DUF4240 domain-containing protein n=1 Tax=unclassified Streptomyces TaxID=2593676 RepID=UPI0004CAD05C|nr:MULTISPECIES: DUF4240 domain-containing protein [unclassified Streptomyces]KOV71645.1 hypothetical protein ADL02_45750 [Streptomyces sp. NRRL WC-3723]